MSADYWLEIASPAHRRRAIRWLWLAVLSLLTAGVFSVLLVLARTPAVGEWIPFVDFFHTALVIHVNLSILVWTMAFAGVLWSLAARNSGRRLNDATFILVCIATATMALSGFVPDAKPIMSNYVPILDNAIFLTGLLIFGVGVGLEVLTALGFTNPVGRRISADGALRFGLNCAAVSVFVALLVLAWSWYELPLLLGSTTYYELLFWGSGHVLQFTYTLLMMVAWLWLASTARLDLIVGERVVLLLFFVGLISVFVAPLIHYSYGAADPMLRQMYTWLMSYGGSLATFPLAIAVYFGLLTQRPSNPSAAMAHAALMSSLLLFGIGGIIGFMIRGNDVTVPAHYHGCIVGVTLALMGVAYDLLPRLGFPRVNLRHAYIQIWTYAAGQFLHILGLVWSGGYGVERKIAGAEQALDSLGRVAGMGLMGLGGLISSIGGLVFIIIVVRALMSTQNSAVVRETP